MKKFLSIFLFLFASAFLFGQECSNLFISEYVEGTGNNKAIELYNPTNQAIDLSNFNLVRYSNGDNTPYPVHLGGIIQPKSTWVGVLDKRDPNGTGQEVPVDLALQAKADTFLCPVYEVSRTMYFNGNDAVTLETTTGQIIDIFAQVGPPMLADDNGWGNLNDTTITYNSNGNPTQYTIQNYIVGPLFWLAWTMNHTLIRKTDVSEGVKINPNPYFIVDIQWDSLPENTFDSLGSHNCGCTTFGFGENKIQSRVDIYPNPVLNNEFSVDAAEQIKKIELVDLTGREIETREFGTATFASQLVTREKLRGVFIVKVSFQNGAVYTKKLLFK
jgi:hypothetical protein